MKSEVQDHIDKAEDSLNAARLLLQEGFIEACINRAYYSMFDAVRTLLFLKDVFAKTHKGVQQKFHELYLKTEVLPSFIGTILSQTEDKREQGDYEFEPILTVADAKKRSKMLSLS